MKKNARDSQFSAMASDLQKLGCHISCVNHNEVVLKNHGLQNAFILIDW